MYTGDLMVDNYVMVDKKIGKVAFISDAGYCLVRIDETHSVETDNPQPVPLTKEILEKNGFKEMSNYYDYYYFNRAADGYIKIKLRDLSDGEWEISIEDYNKFNDSSISINIEKSFLKVHELQQALRLCKIGKEIIL